jgi:hypothetical protein
MCQLCASQTCPSDVLTVVLLFGCEPLARWDIIWQYNDGDDGNGDCRATFDHEQDAPRFKLDVNEGYAIGDDTVDETTAQRQ